MAAPRVSDGFLITTYRKQLEAGKFGAIQRTADILGMMHCHCARRLQKVGLHTPRGPWRTWCIPDAELIKLYESGKSLREIGVMVDRRAPAVELRLCRLGVQLRVPGSYGPRREEGGLSRYAQHINTLRDRFREVCMQASDEVLNKNRKAG